MRILDVLEQTYFLSLLRNSDALARTVGCSEMALAVGGNGISSAISGFLSGDTPICILWGFTLSGCVRSNTCYVVMRGELCCIV